MPTSSVRLAQVLAHQGGWDEMLLVAGPIIVIIALLALAKRRVDRAAADATSGAADATSAAADATSAAAGWNEPGRVRDTH